MSKELNRESGTQKDLEKRIKQLEDKLEKIIKGKVRLKAKDVRISPNSTFVMDCE